MIFFYLNAFEILNFFVKPKALDGFDIKLINFISIKLMQKISDY